MTATDTPDTPGATAAGARVFSDDELGYLASQRLGRLATVAPDGRPQNSPVSFQVRPDGTVEIYGYDLGASRKFRNVAATGVVSLVVDDIASVDPWRVRGVEIRGTAAAITDVDPPQPWLSREVIRIQPRRVLSWGLDPDAQGLRARAVPGGA
ncbi:PPOX class F420-dependent oxidoreductase [Frankia sp. CNm7]|uniref:PPOX class F420-dependent oxidoreductase n=1 Tax=Frankia nepalensis TaxID=1836974 RepID=A0A937RIP2_9ACTN|nr:PPOX class F420-dependent oxidoreductase [Frankia nepalensis]MBL7502617.1 PPOX class F420-dependent oxidoreductase [Frankia nepalensis]MBL7514795.1 PPOX class F420-dependent oxidoreductase [Frankia nepalensis]MBL7522858.1 PPOX class F420-dependent oxidoreductase [Frankia nepalensis]MBL7629554.1 PPOX class F420-dependent oxidoreductase [Frankia nepalensis]